MMRKSIWIVLGLGLLMACSAKTENKDYTKLSEEEVLAEAKKIAHETIIVDGHMDLPFRMYNLGNHLNGEVYDFINRQTEGNIDYVRAKEGGLDAPFMAIYIPASYQEKGGAKVLADTLIMMVERLVNTWPDKLALAKSPQEIEENFKKGLLSLPMGIENGAAIEDDINNLQYFFDRGIRYMTLTHGKDNLIGDSSYDTARTNNGLSDFGKKVVLEMNRLGMIVDVSHVDDKTFFDVAEVSKAPLVATHSSARHFTPGFERNVSDEIIQKIAEKKGMVMITFGGSFIDQGYAAAGDSIRAHIQEWLKTNNLTMQDSAAQAYIKAYRAQHAPTVHVSKIAEHIDHVVKLVGIDYVGLGSDFDGVGDSLPEGMKDASMYPNLIAELLKMGYSREDIEKICHKNFFRVWNDILNAAG